MDSRKLPMKVDNGAFGQEIVDVEYPPNSHKVKDKNAKPVKKVEKVISGKVVTQKKSLTRKIKETLFGDDINSVNSYILYDVIIPATKSTISEMVSGGIEMLLFGETRGSRTRRDKGKSYVSYSSYYGRDRDDRRDRDRDRRDISPKNRASHNFDDIVLDQRPDAEEVLSHLVDLIEDYGVASVADLYSLVDIEPNYTDDKYGWTNLADAFVERVRGGYLIRLPRTKLID